ncbi:hypothetical protein FACS189419_06340 [Planctomycetales bacterium]|nr:hypothetical protein FACS189419_06340 [Planctomycetales bacterium]
MRKILYSLAALLLGSSIVIADDLNYWDNLAVEPIPAVENTQGGLTPKRANSSVVLAQDSTQDVRQVSSLQVIPPAPTLNTAPASEMTQFDAQYTPLVGAAPKPVVEPAGTTDTSAIYAELHRLTDDIEKLKKDTKKPDTKNAWSSPKIGGRVFYDSYTVDQSDDFAVRYFKNKAGIREARLAVTGTGYDSFDYKLEIGLNSDGNGINLYDTWLGAKNVPLLGYFRVGHYRIETGIGTMQSGLHTTLTEFTDPSRTFALGRKLGFSSEHLFANERIRLFTGLFEGENINGAAKSVPYDDQGMVFNTRLTFAPYYAQEGRYLLTFGGHYIYNSNRTGLETLSARAGGLDWMNNALTTGAFRTNHSNRGGLEAAYQAGSFNVRSEAFWAKFAGDANDGKTASGFSTELSYFLTGENRSYNLSTATFGAVKPKHNFHPFKNGDWNLVDGLGAWQVVLQYAYTDLGDWRTAGAFPRGGRQNDITAGLNWFWTTNVRWIFEYTHSQQNWGTAGNYTYENIFGASVRFHF